MAHIRWHTSDGTPQKRTFPKLELEFLFLISSTCFETEGSSSGRRLSVPNVEHTFPRTQLFVQIHVKRIIPYLYTPSGTAVAQWLTCYATILKVAGSIAAGVIGIFH